jgi:hypothetical protein
MPARERHEAADRKSLRLFSTAGQIPDDKGRITEEPCAIKVCAVSRTDGIATRGGRSSGFMTPRRTTDLDPKGRGDKSMLIKRGTAEDVYAVVLQRLSDKAKTGLFEPQSPAVERHTRR